MAARVKVIDLAKELGVTSKDLIVALEAMGQKGMRAMSPLQAPAANELRVKLGRGRELPEEVKPKRAPKAKPLADEGAEPAVAKKKAAGPATGPKSARKKAEAYLEFLGRHDVLTKLCNRSFYVEEMNRLERKGPFPITIIVADLNGLKAANDQR